MATRTFTLLQQMSMVGGRVADTTGRWPHTTNALLAGCFGIAGDAACQLFERKNRPAEDQEYDSARTARFFAYRVAVWGPIYSGFQTWMERTIGRSANPRIVAAKIFVDEMLWTPPCTALYYFFMAGMEGVEQGGPKALPEGLNRGWQRTFGEDGWDGLLWKTLKLNWPFWCVAHTVTYTVVPLRARVAFVSLVSVFWSGVLSNLNESDRQESEWSDLHEPDCLLLQ